MQFALIAILVFLPIPPFIPPLTAFSQPFLSKVRKQSDSIRNNGFSKCSLSLSISAAQLADRCAYGFAFQLLSLHAAASDFDPFLDIDPTRY